MKNVAELRNLSEEELNKELLDLRKTQFNLRMKRANGLLDKSHHFLHVRRAIARIKTILSEKVRQS